MDTIPYASQLKNLKQIYYALLSGILLISATITIVTNGSTETLSIPMLRIIKYAAPLFSVVCILLSSLLYKKIIDNTTAVQSGLQEKLNGYKSACICRWAILEAGIIFNIVLYCITNYNYYLVIAFFILVFFILYAPSKAQAQNHLRLSEAEQRSLE